LNIKIKCWAKNKSLIVKGIQLTVFKDGDHDFISLTDMTKAKDGDFFIADWLFAKRPLLFVQIVPRGIS
jgi:hypothetical protein